MGCASQRLTGSFLQLLKHRLKSVLPVPENKLLAEARFGVRSLRPPCTEFSLCSSLFTATPPSYLVKCLP